MTRGGSTLLPFAVCAFALGCFGPGEYIDLNRPDAGNPPDGGSTVDLATIVIDTSSSGADLTTPVERFPILLRLDETHFDFTKVDEDGGNIAFIDADDGLTAHEIEWWDASAKSAAIWVLLTRLEPGQNNRTIHMVLGTEKSSDRTSSAFPKAGGFAGVFHLKESGNNRVGGYGDSSDMRAAATGTNMDSSSKIQGAVGFGQHFDGSSYLSIPGLFEAPANVTLSCWFQADRAEGEIVSIGDNVNLRIDEETGEVKGMYHDGDSWRETRASVEDIGALHYLVYVIDADSRKQTLYVDGEEASASTHGGDVDYTVGYTESTIAVHANLDRFFFTGLIDEVRIETEARSNDWVRLSYENQRTGGIPFIQIGGL